MTTAPSAWTITAAVAAAQSALHRLEAAGDIEADEAAALAVLEQEAPAIDDVLARLLRVLDEAKANAKAAEARIDALTLRRDRYRRQAEEYYRTVFAIMEALSVRKWRNAEFSVLMADGRPSVVITDADALPSQFVRTKTEPDKTAIKTALEDGEVICGAMLSNSLPFLRISTR
mgnify:CR=1 FL=1|tara:strand:- start:1249 stop:1770 length:522 start_codon:yes stop_codon:yes gene_type:complete